MNKFKKSVVVGFILVVSVTLLSAASNAKELYQKTQEIDLGTQSIESIIDTFSMLREQVVKEMQTAREDLADARSRRDSEAYKEAYGRLVELGAYDITQEQTDRLLMRILQEEEPARGTYAGWLFENSAFYHPSLRMDFTLSGDGYHYSFNQRISQKPGTQITLPDGSQIRASSSQVGLLAGWGLTPDTVEYLPGASIAMPYTDQTLYAVWRNSVSFKDSVSGIDVLHEDVSPGSQIAVPDVQAPDDSFRFVGWYDRSTRELIADEDFTTIEGKGAAFEAIWKSLKIEAVNPLYYAVDSIPTRTQVKIGFSLLNQGNVALEGLVAKLSTTDPQVTLLNDTVSLGGISAGMHRTNNSWMSTSEQVEIAGERNTFVLVISANIPKGTVVPFTVTLTDASGVQWTSGFSLTVK